MRLRRVGPAATAAVAAALLVAACGGSSNTADNAGGGQRTVTINHTVTVPASSTTTARTTPTRTGAMTDTTATKTTTTQRALGAACTASDLTPAYLGSNGAAGTIVLGFALKNTGSAACHTYGWPGVEFLSASGQALATNATRTTGDVVGSTPASVLTLEPGQEASFRMVASDIAAGGANCPTASALQIIAPDDTATMKVSVPGIAACGKATVSPMMAGDSAFAGQGGGGGGSNGGSNGGSDGGSGGGGQSGVGSGGTGGSGGASVSGSSE